MENVCLVKIDSKELIANYFLQNEPSMHLYEIGDLDEFYFPFTSWYALVNSNASIGSNELSPESIRFITLVYQSPDVTVVLAFGREEEIGRTALRLLKPYLPSKFFSHFSSNFASELSNSFKAESHGLYMKMSIKNLQQAKEIAEKLHEQNPSVRLSGEDIESVNAFYKEAYPENWFDPRMLQTGQFFGIWDECSSPRRLTVIAGVHVFSPEYNVVALGNIATHPSYRRQGRARLAIAALVKSSIEAGISQIGLNVKADNTAAIEMYRRLGFEEVDYYEENMFYKIE